jgi:hypothetical protein
MLRDLPSVRSEHFDSPMPSIIDRAPRRAPAAPERVTDTPLPTEHTQARCARDEMPAVIADSGRLWTAGETTTKEYFRMLSIGKP